MADRLKLGGTDVLLLSASDRLLLTNEHLPAWHNQMMIRTPATIPRQSTSIGI